MAAQSLLINARSLRGQLTGVQRYLWELLHRCDEPREVADPARDLGAAAGHVWEQAVLPLMVRGRLLWSPANTGPLTLSNQVVTIHDASTLDHPEWFERKFAAWYQYLLPRLVRRVRRVLTVSEFSRERLLAISGVAPEKIVAIPLGVSEDFKPSTGEEIASLRQRFSLERPYVLALGSLEPRKNLKGLFAAWQILLSTNQDCELVVVGDRGRVFRDQGFEKVPEKVRFLGYVDNKDLPALYSGARIFIFPSLYEGFGLPPLEAMACGCPVIVSKTASLPEVCGNACLYCDPYQPEGIAEQMEQIVQDDSLRSKLSEKGMDRASEFSWDRTAERTWKILSEYL